VPRPVEPLQPVANLPAAADDVSEEDAEGEEEEDDLHGEAREDEDDDEDEECDSAELECFKDLCSQTCSKCSSQDGSKTRSLPLSENHRRCFCDPPCRSTHFPFEAWEGNLNHVPLQDLKETVKKMDGQRYWNGENEKKFSFLETEKVLDDFLDVRNWGQPIGGDRFGGQWGNLLSPREEREFQGLIQTLGMEKMAAIRAWTAPDIDLQRCVASVSRKATSKECSSSEDDSKRLSLKTVMSGGLSALTVQDGQPFTRPAKNKEREACTKTQVRRRGPRAPCIVERCCVNRRSSTNSQDAS